MTDNKRLWERRKLEKINKSKWNRIERKSNYNNLQENNILRINKLWEELSKGQNKKNKAMIHISHNLSKIILLKTDHLIMGVKILQKTFTIRIKKAHHSNNITQKQILRNFLNPWQNPNQTKILVQVWKVLKIINQTKKFKKSTSLWEIKWKKIERIS